MIRTVSYVLAGVLVMSTWVVKAEAQANGNPTGGNFAKEHPRRDEVNTRVDNQRARIDQGIKNGTLDKQQAQQLRANDRAIKQQEHADVKANGGYLTGAQQKQINHEENANSQMIRDEKHPQQ
ncbi:MAG: hypothetical protein WCD69_25140 [Xanthobacteraceae bacterium]|jgi:hypothetical protein